MARPRHTQDQMLRSIQARIADFDHDLNLLIETPIDDWPQPIKDRHWMWTGAKNSTLEQQHKRRKRFDHIGLPHDPIILIKPYAMTRWLGAGITVHRVLYALTHPQDWSPSLEVRKCRLYCDLTLCINPCHWGSQYGKAKVEVAAPPEESREEMLKDLRIDIIDKVECGMTSLDALIANYPYHTPQDIASVIDHDHWLNTRVNR